ncbi:MAG: hypothetical protein Pg6A_17980 [Termitinemataceae bacterium]|nr:MAG: hypothetical protein Pg6A_17980 [Termitinemataceae bacterium]
MKIFCSAAPCFTWLPYPRFSALCEEKRTSGGQPPFMGKLPPFSATRSPDLRRPAMGMPNDRRNNQDAVLRGTAALQIRPSAAGRFQYNRKAAALPDGQDVRPGAANFYRKMGMAVKNFHTH